MLALQAEASEDALRDVAALDCFRTSPLRVRTARPERVDVSVA